MIDFAPLKKIHERKAGFRSHTQKVVSYMPDSTLSLIIQLRISDPNVS